MMIALRLLFGCALTVLVILPSAGFAQQKPSPKFEQYLDDLAYTSLRDSALRRQDVAFPMPPCDDIKIVRRIALKIVDVPHFLIGAEIPNSGIWIEHLLVDRCGTRTARNFLASFDGSLKIIPLTPGITLAPAGLQVDIQKAHRPAAAAKLACDEREILVTDTKIVDWPSGEGPWRESWIFAGCDRSTHLMFDFAPDGTGNYTATIVADR